MYTTSMMDLSATQTGVTVHLVRHGETDHNLHGIMQGWLDTPLNDLGLQQARYLGDHLRKNGTAFDACFSSDLVRASRTAQIVMSKVSAVDPKVVTDERIRERYLGDWQGKSYHDRGESVNDYEPQGPLLSRLLSFWDDLFPRPPHVPSKYDSPKSSSARYHILLATHGGPIKALIPALIRQRGYELDPSVSLAKRVTNCSITLVDVDLVGGVWKGRVRSYSDDGYFGEVNGRVTVEGDAEAADEVAGEGATRATSSS